MGNVTALNVVQRDMRVEVDIQSVNDGLAFHCLAGGSLQGQRGHSTASQSLVELRKQRGVALLEGRDSARQPDVNQDGICQGDNCRMETIMGHSRS